MSYYLSRGDIFAAEAEALVNPVNCVGVMGAGLAKAFREHCPEMFMAYREACRTGKVRIGGLHVYERVPAGKFRRLIINFPTKHHWRDPSLIDAIEAGLRSLVDVIYHRNIRSIAIPALGCGLGGLDWAEVKPLLMEFADSMPKVDVLIYEPVEGRQ